MKGLSPSRSFALIGFALGVASCTPPVVEPPATPVQPAPAVAVAPPEEAPSYDPVAEPEGLGGVLRIGSPIADLVMLRDLLPPHTDFGKLASLGPQAVVEVFLGSLGKHVDVAAPLDAVVLREPEGSIILSMVVRDFAEARRQTAGDFDYQQAPDGSFRVKPKRAGKDKGLLEKMELSCSVMRGGAPPVDHLVCAGSQENLEIAGPYLARTLSRRPPVVGLRYELPESLFRSVVAEQRMKLDDKADPDDNPNRAAGRRLGTKLVQQLSDDFKDMALDLKLTPAGVQAGFDLRFRGVSSVFSLAAVGSRGSGVSPLFWKLPKDADLAFYFPGAAPAAMRAAAAPLWADLAEGSATPEFPVEVTRELCARLAKLLLTGGPWVVSHGPAPRPAAKAAAAPSASPPKSRADQYREARRAAAGWFVVALPEPSATWTTTLRELVKISAIPAKKKPLASAPSPGAASPGKGAKRQSSSTTREVPVRPADRLPAGTLHIVHHEEPNPDFIATADKPALEAGYDIHVFIAGSATDTWIALSENEALARTKLHEAMSGDAGTLADRSELAELRSVPSGGVGFLSHSALLGLIGDSDTSDQLAATAAQRKKLAALPAAGNTPLLLAFSPVGAADKEGAAVRIAALLSLPGAIDLVQWLQ